MLKGNETKEREESNVDTETLTVLMSIKNMDIKQFEASSLEDKIKIGRALFTLLGPIEQLKQPLLNLLNDPQIAEFSLRISEVLKPAFISVMRIMFKNKFDQAHALHKLIYFSLAKNISIENSAPEYKDDYLREAILQRAAHMANLELIYLNNVSSLVEMLIEHFMDKFGIILQALFLKLFDEPDFVYEYLKQSLQIYDFLPENKYLTLIIQPDDLWNDGEYDKFKAETQVELLKAKFLYFYNKLSINSDEFLDKFSHLIFNVRQESIRVYEVLAESDRLLMQHCQRKKYNPDKLYKLNQSLITALLKQCEDNINTVSDEQRLEVQSNIGYKINSINEHQSWIKYSSDIQKIDFKLSSFWNQNPVDLLNVVASWFEGLVNPDVKKLISDIVNAKFLIKLADLLIAILPIHMQPAETSESLVKSKAQMISQARNGMIKYLDAVEKAKKGGFAQIKLYLIKLHVFGNKSFKLFTEKDLQLLRFTFADEKNLPLEERLKLYCKNGQFKKVKPLLSEIDNFYSWILIALQNKQANFVLDLFKEIKKRDLDLITVVPDKVIQQEWLLRAALSLSVDQLQSSVSIISMLFKFGPWSKNLIETLADEITEPSILNLFLPPKPVISSTSSGSDNKDEIDISVTQLSAPKSSLVIPSALFKQQSLFAKDPLLKIRIFSEVKCSAEETNVQCYALVMGLIQFFQAYHLTRKDNLIPGFTCDNARRMRNALVHQQVYNPVSSSVFLLLDGEAENLLVFVNALINSVNSKRSNEFLSSQLFKKVLQHGNVLAGQQRSGEREQVKLYHRVLYTHWLSKTSANFARMQVNSIVSADMLEHAKAALAISRQLYCLKEAGCPQGDLELAQAKAIRHLNTLLPVNVSQVKMPGIKKAG